MPADVEELDPILIQVTVPLPTKMIFSAFLEPTHLKAWLCDAAEVEPRVGGRYELAWTASEPAFASRGVLTRMTPEVDLGFTWSPPPAFESLMGDPEHLSEVYVRLQDSPEGIDITLEHGGWKSGEAWEDARSWHFHLWDDRLHQLKPYLLKVAYG